MLPGDQHGFQGPPGFWDAPRPLLVFLAALCLWGVSLGSHAVLDPNEAKHALIAHEMLERDFALDPTVVGVPYRDKPSFTYALMAGAYRAVGVNALAARIPAAAAAVLCLLATYAFSCRGSPREGAVAAGLLAASLFFVQLGRFANLDGLFSTFVAIAAFSMAARADRDERFSPGLLCAAAAGLAVLVKGPAAIVLLVPPALYCVWLRGAAFRATALEAAVFAAIVAAWAVPVWIESPEYLREFVWEHNVRRYFVEVDKFHTEPWWFFVPITALALLPWSVVLPWALPGALRSARPSLRVCALFSLWVVAFFSFSTGKLATYVVPAFPALAAVAAAWLVSPQAEREPALEGGLWLPAGIMALAAPAVAVAALVEAPDQAAAAILFVPMTCAGLAAFAALRRHGEVRRVLRLQCGAFVLTALVIGAFGGRFAEALSSDRDLADALRRSGPADAVVVYRVRPFSFLFYADAEAAYKVSDARYRALLADPGRVVVLTKDKRLADFAVLSEGRAFGELARNHRHVLLDSSILAPR